MLALSGVRCSRYVLTILAYPFRTDIKVFMDYWLRNAETLTS
jgi:hypothetical protein